jgi:hypothetical protein
MQLYELIPACCRMTKVVWLANYLSHYHRTKADAFSRIWPGRFTVLELSNRDELPVLQSRSSDLANVQTLFPGTSMGEVGNAALRKAVAEYLETVRPSGRCLNGWVLAARRESAS